MSQMLDQEAATGAEDTSELTELGDALRDAVEGMAEAYLARPRWIETGFTDLDRKTGGLHPSDLIVIGGRPSMGKTALALGIAFKAARRQPLPTIDADEGGEASKLQPLGHVAIFSPQMTAEQLGLRLCAMESGLSSEQLYRGEIDAEKFGRARDAAIEIHEARLHIDDRPALTIDQIEKRAHRIKREKGLDLIVVDCLQQVVGPHWTRDNRTHELSEIVRRLKALAKALKVPVIAISNLNRQVEDRHDHRPRLTDLRNCGEIEDIADIVLFLHRPTVDLERDEPRIGTPEHLTWQEDMDRVWRRADVSLAKNRHGANYRFRLRFDVDTISFSNCDQHADD